VLSVSEDNLRLGPQFRFWIRPFSDLARAGFEIDQFRREIFLERTMGDGGLSTPLSGFVLCSAFCASSIVLVLRRRPRLRIEADREDRQRIEGRESSGGNSFVHP
jgi:hypothetical protein